MRRSTSQLRYISMLGLAYPVSSPLHAVQHKWIMVVMIEPPLDVLDQINSICDEFERAQGTVEIDQFLDLIPVQFHVNLLAWLIPLDLERRWSRGFPVKPLRSYLEKFPSFLEQPDVLQSLAISEFRIRQEVGDAPAIDDALDSFPELREPLEPIFRRTLFELSPCQVRVFRDDELANVFALDRLIEIGRQSLGEPDSISLAMQDSGKARLIIADRHETSVSRKHVSCEILRKHQIRILNFSARSSVVINGQQPLGAGASCVERPPFTLHLGPKTLRIE
ncbi:MAG: hypothetical protein R3C28_18805 [Pirellulaceae bacterium]